MPMLRFRNRTAGTDHEIDIFNRSDAEPIMEWYGAFYAGDDYDVLISGKVVQMGINGEYQPPTIDGALTPKMING